VQQERRQKANPLEVLGAWLGVWTAPRDVEIPPVPWRWFAIGGTAVVLIAAVVVVVLAGNIDENKDQANTQAAAQKRASVAANRARITKAQAPHTGEAKALLPAAGATPNERTAARKELMDRVEANIYADARARAAAGVIKPVTAAPDCERTPGTPITGDLRYYDCFLATVEIKATERSPEGALGYPFRAVVDYGAFTYTWCKIEQVPGEMLVLLPSEVTVLPPECRVPRA